MEKEEGAYGITAYFAGKSMECCNLFNAKVGIFSNSIIVIFSDYSLLLRSAFQLTTSQCTI